MVACVHVYVCVLVYIYMCVCFSYRYACIRVCPSARNCLCMCGCNIRRYVPVFHWCSHALFSADGIPHTLDIFLTCTLSLLHYPFFHIHTHTHTQISTLSMSFYGDGYGSPRTPTAGGSNFAGSRSPASLSSSQGRNGAMSPPRSASYRKSEVIALDWVYLLVSGDVHTYICTCIYICVCSRITDACEIPTCGYMCSLQALPPMRGLTASSRQCRV